MSYWYNYYLGYMYMETNKIHPLGLFDDKGKIHSVLSVSGSYASPLHEMFAPVADAYITEGLNKCFNYDHYTGQSEFDVHWVKLEDLPKGSYLKKGYFLLEDIRKFEETEDPWDLFYEKLTPYEYNIKVENELRFGLPKPKKDCEGNEFPVYSAGEYGWYIYPDYNSEEWESEVIRQAAYAYEYAIPKDAKIVVLETEG